MSTDHLARNTLARRGVGLRLHDAERASAGYTLYAPIAGGGDVYLVGNDGEIAHQWSLPVEPGRHARLLDDGTLLYNGKQPQDEPLFPIWGVYHGGVVLLADKDSTVLRRLEHPYQHHDIALLANGNLALLTVEPLAPEQAASIRGGHPGSEAAGGVIWGDVVVEITWDGDVVWKWKAIDHLDPADAVLDSH